MSGLALSVAGASVEARLSGALWIADAQALVVADAHFEKGSAFAARGQLLPPYDTGETLARLEQEVEALGPSRLVFLGDAWHDGWAEARLPPAYAARLEALARGRELVWIAGNHDVSPPSGLPGEGAARVTLAGLTLVHEPVEGCVSGEVAGHLHPCARVRGAGRLRCFAGDGQRLILPAFGAYAGGLDVCDPAIAGRLGARRFAAALGPGRVHQIPWRALGGEFATARR